MEKPNSHKHKLSNQTYEETENLNRLITNENIYLDHYNPYNKKTPQDKMTLLVNSTWHWKINTNCFQTLPKTEEKGKHPNLFHNVSIT